MITIRTFGWTFVSSSKQYPVSTLTIHRVEDGEQVGVEAVLAGVPAPGHRAHAEREVAAVVGRHLPHGHQHHVTV